MSIPVFGKAFDDPAFMTPDDRLATRFADPADRPEVPQATVFTLQEYLLEAVADRPGASEIGFGTDLYDGYTLTHNGTEVAVVGNFGIGAPTLGIVAEELIALGASRLLVVGGCGTLQDAVRPGDAIVVSEAIRDEGTSHHYLPDARNVRADPALTDALETAASKAGIEAHVGTSWTTDAFYRETTTEIDHYRAEGVLTVEMEAASLFAIARYRDVSAGAILAPFDRLTGEDWIWTVSEVEPRDRLVECFEIGLDALVRTA